MYTIFYSPLLFYTAGSDVVLWVHRDFWKFRAHTHMWAQLDFSLSPSSPLLHLTNNDTYTKSHLWRPKTHRFIRAKRSSCFQHFQKTVVNFIPVNKPPHFFCHGVRADLGTHNRKISQLTQIYSSGTSQQIFNYFVQVKVPQFPFSPTTIDSKQVQLWTLETKIP